MAYIYILANKFPNVIYIGSTGDLKRRVYFHKNGFIPGFTKKYNVDRLVYFEKFLVTEDALFREKQIKKYKREKKDLLIQKPRPTWDDLYETL